MRRPRSFIGPGAMGGMVSLWGASSLVASVQRGTVAAGSTAAITAVDVTRSVIRFLGVTNDQGATNNYDSCFAYLSLSNSTTVAASRVTALGITTVSFEVIEFAPGVVKSVQRGTVVIAAAAASGTAAITAVHPSKAEATTLGFSTEVTSASGGNLGGVCAYVSLTNATTVTASRVSAAGTNVTTVAYQVVEWF